MPDTPPLAPLVDLKALGWPAARAAAALAVAAPNNLRVAQAALQRLTLDDHPGSFAAWCAAEADRPRQAQP